MATLPTHLPKHVNRSKGVNISELLGRFEWSTVPLFLATIPYYRSLRRRTLDPTRDILRSRRIEDLKDRLEKWIIDKESELSYVSTAATVITALSVAIFTWPSLALAPWYVTALFYASLVLALTSLIAVSQENILLADLHRSYTAAFPSSTPSNPLLSSPDISSPPFDRRKVQHALSFLASASSSASKSPAHHTFPSSLSSSSQIATLFAHIRTLQPSKTMLFFYQAPLMLMSYSWVVFVVALTLHVLRPFLLGAEWNDDSKVAVVFIAVAAPCGCLFIASGLGPEIGKVGVEREWEEVG